MTTDLDPLVARALDHLVAGAESDPAETIRRARVRVDPDRTRFIPRPRRTAILAFAVLALLAGTALAAAQFDALPWLDRSNESSATFSIDPSQTYQGPAPEVLVCPQASSGSFSCSEAALPSSGRRAYMRTARVEAQPQISRDSYLRAVVAAEQKSQIDSSNAARVRRDIGEAGDDFFTGLAALTPVQTVGAGQEVPGRPGFELGPPAGVPMWIACESTGVQFRCHDLASSRDVALGTPLYLLQSSSDWVARPRNSQRPVDVGALFHAILGRDLKPAEARLLVDFITLGSSAGTSTAPVQERPTKTQSP